MAPRHRAWAAGAEGGIHGKIRRPPFGHTHKRLGMFYQRSRQRPLRLSGAKPGKFWTNNPHLVIPNIYVIVEAY